MIRLGVLQKRWNFGSLCTSRFEKSLLFKPRRTASPLPLGEYPELTKRGIPITGTENFGGAVVTAGGTRDNMIRAFDKDDGTKLWKYKRPFGGCAPPATYTVGGKQYRVIPATGGGKLGGPQSDTYIAFVLP
ncbi:MAG: PQQ-binding-like beta-propeller repeat protein [Rhodospirillales bacterium]|nr:PQQ-binding-like beta-propeller repeat protein [Rhodospirillales bacterium]